MGITMRSMVVIALHPANIQTSHVEHSTCTNDMIMFNWKGRDVPRNRNAPVCFKRAIRRIPAVQLILATNSSTGPVQYVYRGISWPQAPGCEVFRGKVSLGLKIYLRR